MSMLRFAEPLSREARRETGRPPQPSRERDLLTRPRARTRVEDPHERSADASLRRREKYAAAVVLSCAISAALTGTVWAGGLTGDAVRGETLYQVCTDCHSLDKKVLGRVIAACSASLPDYDYSDALKSANIVWNEETLDKWLTDPQAVAPGAKMFFHLDNPQDRADVIAYLKERAK